MNYEIITPSPTRVVLEEGTKGVYEIDSLAPGYGHTVGNSLRRVLLSSLPGAAITRVKIKGVSHEFSTIPDIKEDVINLLLNLKQVRFLMHTDLPQIITLSAKGIKKITAGDFEVPTQIEVINKDSAIASLTSKEAKLEIEATVEKGLGYVPREVLEKEKVEVGSLTLDAIFSPLRKVNYEVENMRVGDRTDYNRLRLSIETDGSISPREAFSKSVDILMKQLSALAGFEGERNMVEAEEKEKGATEAASAEVGDDDPLKIRTEDLGLSSRTANALASAGIRTVGGLVQKTKEDLMELQGIGEKAVDEIREALANMGLYLR